MSFNSPPFGGLGGKKLWSRGAKIKGIGSVERMSRKIIID